MSEKINIAIIGGGIIGCCVALELARDQADIYVFEKNPGITKGENQSSRNSGVLHAGIYYEQDIRPLKGRLCIEGNRLWCEFARKYGFFPDLTAADLEYHQGGTQARLDGHHDFYIKPDRNSNRVIHMLGIDSPGLTAAPAIAKYVSGLLKSE